MNLRLILREAVSGAGGLGNVVAGLLGAGVGVFQHAFAPVLVGVLPLGWSAVETIWRMRDHAPGQTIYVPVRPLTGWQKLVSVATPVIAIGVIFYLALTRAGPLSRDKNAQSITGRVPSSRAAPTAEPSPLSLKQLFATDLRPSKSLTVGGYYLVPLEKALHGNDLSAVVWFNVYYDTLSDTNFPSYFIGHLDKPDDSAWRTIKTSRVIAARFPMDLVAASSQINGKMEYNGDETEPVNTKDYRFSGKVYIYHFDRLTVGQRNELAAVFQKHGANLVLRGQEYADDVNEEIKAGDVSPPPALSPWGVPLDTKSIDTVNCQHRQYKSIDMRINSRFAIQCTGSGMAVTVPTPRGSKK